MPAYAWWFVLALALAGGELLTSTFYLLVLGAAGLTLGLVLWMRRRDYRASQREYDTHSLDR